jgi:hypothetical protein
MVVAMEAFGKDPGINVLNKLSDEMELEVLNTVKSWIGAPALSLA